MRRQHVFVLCACFLLSGLSSLTLEVVWSKYMSYILGSTLYGVATVVASFMGGMAIGSGVSGKFGSRFSRPLRIYALIQISVSLYGLASLYIFSSTEPIFRWLYHWTNPGNPAFLFARFAFVFALVAIPATLLGMTLPLLVGSLVRSRSTFHADVGLLYGINTVGATLGTLLAGFILLPQFGLQKSCVIAGILDAAAGVIALYLDRITTAVNSFSTNDSILKSTWTSKRIDIAILFSISGMIAFWSEIAWFRLLGLIVGPSVYAFSAMLGVYLAGIGVGSLASPTLVPKTKLSANESCGLIVGGVGIFILIGLHFYNSLPKLYEFLFSKITRFAGQDSYALALLALSGMVVLIPCLFMGALFPAVSRAFAEAGSTIVPQKTVGFLYLLNTLGGIIGSLTAGFFLIPFMGVWNTLIAAGILSVLVAACYFAMMPQKRSRWVTSASIVVCGAFILAWFSPRQNISLLNRGLYRFIYHGQQVQADNSKSLLYYQEGINSPVAVYEAGAGASLHIAGKADASTLFDDLPTQSLSGHFPIIFSRSPKRVALIGYGSGMTVASVLAYPEVKQVDVIEIEKAVLNASPYFHCINGNPFADPRTRTILEDARVHFAYTDVTYDVITSEPSNPWMAGVSNLFSTDFYRKVRSHLSKDGIFGQWLQLYELTEPSWKIALTSIKAVFPHVVIFQGGPGDAIILASPSPIRVSWTEFQARFNQQKVKESFRRLGLRNPEEAFFFFRASDTQISSYLHGFHKTNTDDNLLLESNTPRELMQLAFLTQSNRRSPREVLLSMGSAERLAGIESMVPGIPIADLIRRCVSFGFSMEPDLSKPQNASGPFVLDRSFLIKGMFEELEASGAKDLAQSLRSWTQESQHKEENRYATAFALAQASRNRGITESEARRAVENAPDLPIANVLLAKILFDAGKYKEAKSFYQAVLDYPESASFYDAIVGMGNVAINASEKKDQYDEALQYYLQAIQYNPYYPDAFLNVATIYWKRNNFLAAKEVLESGLKTNPSDPLLRRTLDSIEH